MATTNKTRYFNLKSFKNSKIFRTFADASAKTPKHSPYTHGHAFFHRVKVVKKVDMANFMKNFRPLKRFFAAIATLAAIMFPCSSFGDNNTAQGVKVVVLDAGHGGRYAGAHRDGISEKDINLQVVLKLGALIQKELPHIKVVYTRTTDKHFSDVLGADLQARADIAHRNNGDVFISVHSNAMPGKPEVRGTVTLIMGETQGEINRNENALYVNNKEELLDMSDHKTATIVRAYIQNLQYTYGVYSQMMGRFMQDEYAALGYRDLGVRGQPLKVLYSTDMPSVLTEIGFMTNTEEFKYITSEEGQEQIVGALFRAIKRYIEVVNRSILVDGAPKTTPQAPAPVKKEPAKKVETKAQTPTPAQTSAQPKPKPITVKHYTIQLMLGKENIPVSQFNFKSYQGKVWILETAGDWPYKYCYGDFNDMSAAQKELAAVKQEFPQAFVRSFDKQE